jgi:hypothetical protein
MIIGMQNSAGLGKVLDILTTGITTYVGPVLGWEISTASNPRGQFAIVTGPESAGYAPVLVFTDANTGTYFVGEAPWLDTPTNGAVLQAGTTDIGLYWTWQNNTSSVNVQVFAGTPPLACGGTNATPLVQVTQYYYSSYDLTGLSNGQTYYWRVQKVNGTMVWPYSACFSFTVSAS